jgi:site-specific DNA-methyltransferase (adenine-specific)
MGIASLWTAVLRYPEALIQRIQDFAPSVEAFHRLKEFLQVRKVVGGHEGVVELGFANLAIHQLSYGGRGTMAAGALGGWAQQAYEKVDHRWKPARLVEKIQQCHDLLTAYEIEGNACSSFDFQRVLAASSARMLVYLDPPYFAKSKPLYHLGFTEEDHCRLAAYLRTTDHAWVLSYDDHPVIRKMYDWAVVETLTVDYSSRLPKTAQELVISPKQVLVSCPQSPTSSAKEDTAQPPLVESCLGAAAMSERKYVRLDEITLDEQLFSRADGLRQDIIDEYREGLQCGDTFPAVTVFFDGTHYYLVDGFYRYHAYRLEQIKTIEAEIHQGSLRDALLYSAGINQKHGVRRTNADKWRAVKILLEDEEWSQWSDNAIAKHCGVDHKTVAKYRQLALASLGNSQVNPVRKYRHKHAGLGTMQTANIGKRPGQHPEPLFHTTQVFDHVRQLLQSYEVSYPGFHVEYEQQRNALTIRVTPSKYTASQGAVEDVAPSLEPFLNQIVHGDCLDILPTMPSNSIPLVVTDLPSTIGLIDAGDPQDDKPYHDYLEWLRACLVQLYRIGTPDCRYAINIATDTSKGGITRTLYSDVLQIAKCIGFQYKSEIPWRMPVFKSTAFGAWGSVSAPQIVSTVERVMLLYKHQWQKQRKGVSDDLGADVLHLVQGFWVVDPDETQDVSLHLAKLPLEIPLNLIKLLSYKDDVVLDPFGGSGSVAVAAKQLGRPYILIEQAESYCVAAKERLERVA